MGRIYQHILEEVERETLKEGKDVAWKKEIFSNLQEASLYSFI